MRSIVARLLVTALVAALLLPIALAVVLGLAALLDGLGDHVAAVVCRRSALAVGVAWIIAIIVTAVAGGIVAVDVAGRDPQLPEKTEPPVRREEG